MKNVETLVAKQNRLEADILLCWKWLKQARSQNDNQESRSLLAWAEKIGCDKSFVEFGFSVFEYNSVDLTKAGFKGLLLDSSVESCQQANLIFRRLELNAVATNAWITLNSLSHILEFCDANGGQLGVLNIDIDGNDYWILKSLLDKINPEIICVEHNASMGFNCISTPYAADFDRHAKHESGLYHGASIVAFEKLLFGRYGLVENIAGLNLIFIRTDIICANPDIQTLRGSEALMEPVLRNKMNRSKISEQWKVIRHLPFEEV